MEIGKDFLKMIEERSGKPAATRIYWIIIAGIYLGFALLIIAVAGAAVAAFKELFALLGGGDVVLYATILASIVAILVLVVAGASLVITRLSKSTAVSQDALNELSRLRADGINNFFAVKPVDDADFGKWDMGYHQWEEKIKEHLETHFTEADYLRFCNLGRVQIIPFDDSMIYSPEHLRLVRLMSKQLDIIEEFLATYRRQ